MFEPTTIILFGITGDLAQKKILPALYDLYERGELPAKSGIVGFSRRPFTSKEIRDFVKETLKSAPNKESISKFLEIITYVQGEFDKPESYAKLGEHLMELDKNFYGGCSNKLFYLSVPPTLYETIAKGLSASGLSIPCGGPDGFSRILVEKPFGKDLETARALDELFGKLFKEEQVFRIDHYLAKDTLNSMLRERSTDPKLREIWNNNYISKVEINLFEKADVHNRAAFYDGVGALRDVGQNHMLQMLAITAMDTKENHTPVEIQKARASILQKIIPLTSEEIQQSKKGQYEGYLQEPGVAPGSKTETFFSLRLGVDMPDFSGVPFVLTSGKALSEDLAEIIVHFKNGDKKITRIPPSDSMAAYEKILLDCIAGDQTVFTSTAEVMAEWEFVTPIVIGWKDRTPFVYPKGSDPKLLISNS